MDWSYMLEEVLLDVFSRLDPFKDVAMVMLVCKAWNNLVQDRSLWRRWHDEHLGGAPCPPFPVDGWRESFVKTMLAVRNPTRLGFSDSASGKALVAAKRGCPVLFHGLLRKNPNLLTDGLLAKRVLCEAAKTGCHTFLEELLLEGKCPWSAHIMNDVLSLYKLLGCEGTPLAYAANRGHEGVVRCLLEAANEPVRHFREAFTFGCALDEAIRSTHANIVRLLVPFYDLNMRDCCTLGVVTDATSLIQCALRPLVEAGSSHAHEVRVVEVLDALFEGGLVMPDWKKSKALSYAANTKSNAIMECLFSHGFSPSQLDIISAVKMDDVEKVRFMLWHGAACEDTTLSELVYYAKRCGFKEILSLLRNPPRKEAATQKKDAKQKRTNEEEEEEEEQEQEEEDNEEKEETKEKVENSRVSKKRKRNQEKKEQEMLEELKLEDELRRMFPEMFEGRLDVFTLHGLLGRVLGSSNGLPQTKLTLLQALHDVLFEHVMARTFSSANPPSPETPFHPDHLLRDCMTEWERTY
ncbi:Coiled-coil domain containing 180 [Balamuthia mandrillaris]